MNIKVKEIAKAHGLSYHTVRRWPEERLQQEQKDLDAGVRPAIAKLIGELAAECYRAQAHLGEYVHLDIGTENSCFWVWFKNTVGDMSCIGDEPLQLNAINLSGAIVAVRELYL
jgi:hypothetical protein